ncbi:MAG: hypothetical protein IH899_15525 [Planctomycetes bacterium]|nr:hypothetical protein [Planctomycetota bacterium]
MRSRDTHHRKPFEILYPGGGGGNILLAKTTAAHAKGVSQDVDLYSGPTKGSETPTGKTVSAYNRFADLETGKWCLVAIVDGGYEMLSAEC